MRATAPALTVPVSDRDHVRGPETARLTLVEYGDYECPHCGAAHPIVQHLLRQFRVDLLFAFRNFPLTEIHPHAAAAASIAEAADRQDKFWPAHDAIFENQALVVQGAFGPIVSGVDLDTDQLESDLSDPAIAERIKEDFMSGVRSGVNGTPTFFVNGARFDGRWDTELEPYLQSLLEDP